MHSCLYEGKVRHRRFVPNSHEFVFPLFMVYLDLDEMEQVFALSRWWSYRRFNLAWFRRKDFLGPDSSSLKQAVTDLIHQKTGQPFDGSVRMLCHVRYFGYGFNPVTFYFCFEPGSPQPAYLVAQINNTPWNERYSYVFSFSPNTGDAHCPVRIHQDKAIFEFDKAFHVSPFNPMDMRYRWSVQTPGEELLIHMANTCHQEKHFDSTLNLTRHAIEGKSLNRVLIRYPFMTLRVMTGIYWQSLRLWLKKTPFYDHPPTDRKPGETL